MKSKEAAARTCRIMSPLPRVFASGGQPPFLLQQHLYHLRRRHVCVCVCFCLFVCLFVCLHGCSACGPDAAPLEPENQSDRLSGLTIPSLSPPAAQPGAPRLSRFPKTRTRFPRPAHTRALPPLTDRKMVPGSTHPYPPRGPALSPAAAPLLLDW